MSKRPTQKDFILDLLKEGKTISSKEAFEMGITRLSAIIHTLRNEGYDINKEMISYMGSWGRVTYAKYNLKIEN